MMEHFRSHPFKANDRPIESKHFKFRFEELAQQHLRYGEKPQTKEERDLEECNKKFKALPMPKISPSRQVETSEAIHGKSEKEERKQKSEEEERKPFRARPVPLSTYVSSALPGSPTRQSADRMVSKTPPVTVTPTFAHSRKIKEAIRVKAEAKNGKESSLERKRGEKYEE
jgi:hypothetical protein